MVQLNDVLKNWGDFKGNSWVPNFGGMRESLNSNVFAETLGDNVDTRGLASAHGYREMMTQRVGKRRYEARLAEAAKLIFRGFNGSRRDQLNFQEAMSISDFPNLFGDVIDRAVLANYLETPYTWSMIANQSDVSDFRPVKRFRVDGGTGLLGNSTNSGALVPIDPGGQYPEDSLSDNFYTYQLAKYGKRMPFYWETFVNDDLNAIKDTPARFGRGARRSEEYFVTRLFANAVSGGPAPAILYSNTNKNIVNAANAGGAFTANNPPLSLTGLQQALVVMMNQVDTTNQPISVEAVTLVVPPALKTIAMNILNTDYVWMADQGGTTNVYGSNTAAFAGQMLQGKNWAKNIVRLALNYYLPILDTNHGQTGWYLFANPENGRPAIEFGKLRGHANPELYMKLPNSVAIGEGTMGPGPGVFPGTTNMNPMEGDFDTDAVHYKIRHVFGGTTIDPIMTVYSNGSNS